MALRAKKIGRASRTFAQLWQVPTFLVGLVAFVLVAATTPLRQDSANPEFAADIAFLRNSLAKKVGDAGTEALAESVVARANTLPDRVGEVHFLAGSVFQQLADAATDVRQIELRHKASLHLEKAHSAGVPAGDAAALQFRLGRLLFETNGDLKRAADLLTRSMTTGANLQGYSLLTTIHLRLNNLDGALAANLKHVDLIEKKNELDQALLLRGELWLKKDNRLEALKALDRIGPKAANDVRIAARLLQARCCEEESQWSRAAGHWRELLAAPDKVPAGRKRVLYSLGLALANSTPAQHDEARKVWLQASEAGGPEAQAALLRLSEWSLRASEPDTAAALDHLAKALRSVQTPGDYQNSLIDVAGARIIFETGCRHLEQAKDYTQLQELAETYRKIALAGVAEAWLAQGLAGRAKSLAETGANATGAEAELARQESRSSYQKAGEAFEQAARAREAGARSDVLWRAAQCYLAAKDVVPATVVLGRFVHEEKTESRLAEGWLLLAETYAALGKKTEALDAYYKCIEYPSTPFAFRARYQLALEELAESHFDQAHDILIQNLTPAAATADRQAHEKSLFKLAELLYQREEFEKACIRLKEAIEVYPANSAAITARDQLGDCYRRFADVAAKKWQKQPEELHHRRARDGWLDQAYTVYEKLAEDLGHQASDGNLPPEHAQLLIRAKIVPAHVHLERGELEEALRRYHEVFQKQRHFGRLVAIQGIFTCAEQAKTPEFAQRALDLLRTSAELTLMDVEQMRDTDPPFDPKNPIRTRGFWINWLTSLRTPLPPRVNVPAASVKQPSP